MIPVASVVTQKSLPEFLLLKMSLEQYHDVKWYLSTDAHATEALKSFSNVQCQTLVKTDDCGHGGNDPDKNRLFLELVMTKFDAIKACIADHGTCLLIDADIFFTNPIEDKVLSLLNDDRIDAILSPHMTNNLILETKVGHYNVGFLGMRNLEYLRLHEEMSWKHKELDMYYEQQPLQFTSYNFLTANLPINYNIGWWRFNERQTHHRLDHLSIKDNSIYFYDLPAVCFHAHTLKKLNYTNFGKFLVDKVVSLMKQCDNKKYDMIVDFIENQDQ